jgi:SOS-response transcriptional repressor LexA
MMSRPLTFKQQEILNRIRQGIKQTGRAPTYRKLAAEFMVTVTAIAHHVDALEKKGLVWRHARTIHVTEAA